MAPESKQQRMIVVNYPVNVLMRKPSVTVHECDKIVKELEGIIDYGNSSANVPASQDSWCNERGLAKSVEELPVVGVYTQDEQESEIYLLNELLLSKRAHCAIVSGGGSFRGMDLFRWRGRRSA